LRHSLREIESLGLMIGLTNKLQEKIKNKKSKNANQIRDSAIFSSQESKQNQQFQSKELQG
jgi:hypothetical protein